MLVLEPPLADGGLKTARKGDGKFTLDDRGAVGPRGGRAREGHSAVVELAHQILAIDGVADPEAGTTVNVGVVAGGTASNVVAAQATRRSTSGSRRWTRPRRVERRCGRSGLSILRHPARRRRLQPPADGADTRRRRAVRTGARGSARSLGIELTEGSTGGGSDGNFTAALGVATLDGLGALGGGAHAVDEHVVVASMPKRAALLAALLLEL